MVGSDARTLLLSCFLTGGTFLIIADTLARIVVAPNELPVGVITALVGGPALILALLKHRKT